MPGWVWLPALVAVLSRLYSVTLMLTLNALREEPTPNPFSRWDGTWYDRLVREGYHGNPVGFHPTLGIPWHDFAFFPAWPAIAKVGHELAAPFGVPVEVSSVVIANLLFIPAAVVAWRVIADRLGDRAATAGVALLAFAPPAYSFSMAYSESLFVLLAAASLLPVRSMRLRAPLTAATMFTRVAGGPLVVAAAVQAIRTTGRERRAAIGATLGGILAFGIWFAFVTWLAQSPTGFGLGSAQWNAESGPILQLLKAVQEPSWQQTAWVAFCALSAVAGVMLLRRDVELGVFAVGCMALVLLPGTVAHSWPRYMLAAFPVFAVLGDRLWDRFGRVGPVALVVLFALAQVPFAAWTVMTRSIAP